ncbi:F390 synthetase-related protein [Sebaldella sp. S0638]|uniref:F390 synthetase-related protein n=1 Tax=Sebaldella sp. S0638 TaxID=2957809 RepID=UPI0020A1E324|nr:F390 synthetase-related protein [Sebaldella sp. S0638]MCP1223124.1 CoF synthetase [Sebaldella sp. S0638]
MSFKFIIFYYYLKYKFFMKINSKEKLELFQKKKIEKHLNYITKKSKYYFGYKGKELKDFPVIDKKVMMENFDEMNTVGIHREQALEIAMNSEKTRNFKEKYKNITVGLSSGTSGNRGLFTVSDFERAKWTGIILAKLLPYFILKKQKIALFLRADSELYNSVNSMVLKFQFFDMIKDYIGNIKELNKFSPDVLIAPASMLKILAENINDVSIKPKRIFSCAEVLTKEDREYITGKFNMQIGEIYQATEGFLGYSFDSGQGLKINEDVLYIEKEYIDSGKTRFIPVITDFERKSQPVIRYRLNDIWVENKNFGGIFLKLEKIEGREDDIFILKGKDSTEIKVFPDFIRRAFMFSSEEILEYNVIQKTFGDIDVSFIPGDSGEYNKIKEKIKENLLDLFSGFNADTQNININFSVYEEKYRLTKKRDIKRGF